MGLDMYLFARGGVNADTGERIQDDEIGYWRKFNALHSLFLEVGGADPDSNCEEVSLTLENLEYVYGICKEIKDILDKATKYSYLDNTEIMVNDVENYEDDYDYYFASEVEDAVCGLMAPHGGFFWGNTDVDYEYHHKVARTLPILEKAIELAKQGEEIYYYCWW